MHAMRTIKAAWYMAEGPLSVGGCRLRAELAEGEAAAWWWLGDALPTALFLTGAVNICMNANGFGCCGLRKKERLLWVIIATKIFVHTGTNFGRVD